MSQSALRPAKKGEEVYVELQDGGGFNIAWGIGRTEREAANTAEGRWCRDFKTKPTRKTIVVRKEKTS